jgi:hypothetical protein
MYLAEYPAYLEFLHIVRQQYVECQGVAVTVMNSGPAYHGTQLFERRMRGGSHHEARTVISAAERGAAIVQFVLLVGIVFIAASAWAAWSQSRILTWPSADAEVTKSTVHRMSGPKGFQYRAEWEFRYTVEGKEYRTPWQSSTMNSSYTRRKAEADGFAVGSRHAVRCDPSNPNAIELNAAPTPRFFLVPIIFFAAGIATIAGCLWLMHSGEAAPRCASCGAWFDAGFQYCPHCGRQTLRDHSAPERPREPNRNGVKGPLIVATVFILAGFAFLVFGARLWVNQHRIATTWQRVEAEVLDSDFVQYRGLRGLFHYNVRAHFRYTVAGQEYKSAASLNDSSSGAGSNAYAYIRAIADRYARGARGIVLVNPENAHDLRFEAGRGWTWYAAPIGLTAFGVVFAAVGIGVFIGIVRARPRECAVCRMPLNRTYRFCPRCATPAGAVLQTSA